MTESEIIRVNESTQRLQVVMSLISDMERGYARALHGRGGYPEDALEALTHWREYMTRRLNGED